MQAARHAVSHIVSTEGVSGLYRGFGTVVLGAIPARVVSLIRLFRSNVQIFVMAAPHSS